jgi:rsbT co-antagonist protein RsbR
MAATKTRIPEILRKNQDAILKDWLGTQEKTLSRKMKIAQLTDESREFLTLLVDASQTGDMENGRGSQWTSAESFLSRLSKSRSEQGFSPTDTANFVLSLKESVFSRLRDAHGETKGELADELWRATQLFDRLALFTTEVFQKSREELIIRQQQDMMELSTPVVKLWDGILALPLIGTLDSSRTQVIMEALLERIVASNSEIAIIDITGVPTVDTLVAQHLIKTVTAARLMGAECIISGIRPQIAATIVHLGVDLSGITTKASLADAFQIALTRVGKVVVTVKSQNALKAKA